jgi:hypothetical protein
VKEIIELKTFDNKKGLKLDVTTASVEDADLSAVEPLWVLMQAAELIGGYILSIKNKASGRVENNHMVKICGQCGGTHSESINILFQAGTDNSYNGYLTRQEGESVALYGSKLLHKLREIAGQGWFDPRDSNKVMRPGNCSLPPLTVKLPLPANINIEDASKTSSQIMPVKGAKPLKNLVENLAILKVVFELLEKESDDLLVSTETISKIIIHTVLGKDGKASGKSIGPIIKGCKNRGWLKAVGKKLYVITPSALKQFEINSFEANSNTAPALLGNSIMLNGNSYSLALLKEIAAHLRSIKSTQQRFVQLREAAKQPIGNKESIFEELRDLSGKLRSSGSFEIREAMGISIPER